MLLLDRTANGVEVDRALRNQNYVRAARDTRVHRDPARIAAHHFHDDYAIVRLRGSMQPVNALGGNPHSRVESKRKIRARQVVVDRLGAAYNLHTGVVELLCHSQRVIAANGDQSIKILSL